LHSGGIPVRAMLDELIQIDAIEPLEDQRVRAKSRIPILTGLTKSAISGIGQGICSILLRKMPGEDPSPYLRRLLW
jgi:transketolase C-terminal domain/subunit